MTTINCVLWFLFKFKHSKPMMSLLKIFTTMLKSIINTPCIFRCYILIGIFIKKFYGHIGICLWIYDISDNCYWALVPHTEQYIMSSRYQYFFRIFSLGVEGFKRLGSAHWWRICGLSVNMITFKQKNLEHFRFVPWMPRLSSLMGTIKVEVP